MKNPIKKSVLIMLAVSLIISPVIIGGCWLLSSESSTNYRSYGTIRDALDNVYPAFNFEGPVMPDGYTLKTISVEGFEILRLTYEKSESVSIYFNAYAGEPIEWKSSIWHKHIYVNGSEEETFTEEFDVNGITVRTFGVTEGNYYFAEWCIDGVTFAAHTQMVYASDKESGMSGETVKLIAGGVTNVSAANYGSDTQAVGYYVAWEDETSNATFDLPIVDTNIVSQVEKNTGRWQRGINAVV